MTWEVDMDNINNLIQGCVLLIIGTIIIISWKKFYIEIIKHSTKYGKNTELFAQVCFYIMGIGFIIGSIILLYRSNFLFG